MFYKGLLTEMQEMLNERASIKRPSAPVIPRTMPTMNYRFLQASHKQVLDKHINSFVNSLEDPSSQEAIDIQYQENPGKGFRGSQFYTPSDDMKEFDEYNNAIKAINPNDNEEFDYEIEHYINTHPSMAKSESARHYYPDYYENLTKGTDFYNNPRFADERRNQNKK